MTTPGTPLWVTVLIALGFPTLVLSAAAAVWRYVTGRRARRDQRSDAQVDRQETREERRDDRNETWNDQVRTNIERHIPWDAKLLAHVQRLELLVNDLREGQGKPAVVFVPLGEPPALFPAGAAPPRDDA